MDGVSIVFDEMIGRRTRVGDLAEQQTSTHAKAASALDSGQWAAAAKYAEFMVDEADVCFRLYRQWIADLKAFLRASGIDGDEVERADAAILEKCALPDGSPFDAHRHWDRFRGEVHEFVALSYRETAADAHVMLDRLTETWRQTHDRDVDHIYGLMSEVQDRLGGQGIADMYQKLLLPLFAWRYDKFDIDKNPWDEALNTLVLVCIEAARGHLFGPGRRGEVELVEHEDRFVLRFDPCGSGGRVVRGDEIEGTPSRMEPPYGWSVSEEPASWNHYTKVVCLYCAHCIVLMEEMPMDRFGYPVRAIDPPIYSADPSSNNQKCQYTMYKDPTAVPVEIYERVGRRKPSEFGSSHFDSPTLPDADSFGLPGKG